jgi:hypothetical protein
MLRVFTVKEAHAAFPPVPFIPRETLFCKFFGGLECVGHFYVYVAHFVFLRDVWIQTQRAPVASRCATKLSTHLPTETLIHQKLAKWGWYGKASMMKASNISGAALPVNNICTRHTCI